MSEDGKEESGSERERGRSWQKRDKGRETDEGGRDSVRAKQTTRDDLLLSHPPSGVHMSRGVLDGHDSIGEFL